MYTFRVPPSCYYFVMLLQQLTFCINDWTKFSLSFVAYKQVDLFNRSPIWKHIRSLFSIPNLVFSESIQGRQLQNCFNIIFPSDFLSYIKLTDTHAPKKLNWFACKGSHNKQNAYINNTLEIEKSVF